MSCDYTTQPKGGSHHRQRGAVLLTDVFIIELFANIGQEAVDQIHIR